MGSSTILSLYRTTTVRMKKLTYRDKTWCCANCKADGACGRKLSPRDKVIIRVNQIPVSFADFSGNCEMYEYDPQGGNGSFKELLKAGEYGNN
jgi:hypothetical protein